MDIPCILQMDPMKVLVAADSQSVQDDVAGVHDPDNGKAAFLSLQDPTGFHGISDVAVGGSTFRDQKLSIEVLV